MSCWIEVLAADPRPALRVWVPIQKSKYKRHEFETREAAEIAVDAMQRANRGLELRIREGESV